VVAEARLLLLDEPLSALDLATRANVRSQLAEILRTLNLTTIIVTHDREEAFEFADRVALLVDGQVQQYGAAQEIYEQPKTLAVAEFMGVNILAAVLLGDNQARLNGVAATLQLPRKFARGPAYLAIAPEQTHIVQHDKVSQNVVAARLRKFQYRGGEYRVQVTLGRGANQYSIEARSKLAPTGESLQVQLPPDSLHVLSQAP
jgi:ABC-type Fe3+/spermidine/putrescine transport system ATPase subunit